MTLLPTSLVGSYAQPDWLIDRAKLAGRFPPRVRAKELWRVDPEYLEQVEHLVANIALVVGHVSSSSRTPHAVGYFSAKLPTSNCG